jgi:hypothetical protein
MGGVLHNCRVHDLHYHTCCLACPTTKFVLHLLTNLKCTTIQNTYKVPTSNLVLFGGFLHCSNLFDLFPT